MTRGYCLGCKKDVELSVVTIEGYRKAGLCQIHRIMPDEPKIDNQVPASALTCAILGNKK